MTKPTYLVRLNGSWKNGSSPTGTDVTSALFSFDVKNALGTVPDGTIVFVKPKLDALLAIAANQQIEIWETSCSILLAGAYCRIFNGTVESISKINPYQYSVYVRGKGRVLQDVCTSAGLGTQTYGNLFGSLTPTGLVAQTDTTASTLTSFKTHGETLLQSMQELTDETTWTFFEEPGWVHKPSDWVSSYLIAGGRGYNYEAPGSKPTIITTDFQGMPSWKSQDQTEQVDEVDVIYATGTATSGSGTKVVRLYRQDITSSSDASTYAANYLSMFNAAKEWVTVPLKARSFFEKQIVMNDQVNIDDDLNGIQKDMYVQGIEIKGPGPFPVTLMLGSFLTSSQAATVLDLSSRLAVLESYASINTSGIPTIVASNTVAAANAAAQQTSNINWTKLKSTSVNSGLSGTARLKFTLTSTAGGQVNGRLYINGQPIGSTFTNNLVNTPVVESQDVPIDLPPGSLLDVYGFCTAGGTFCEITDLNICGTVTGSLSCTSLL
jgi:hypothetical protein